MPPNRNCSQAVIVLAKGLNGLGAVRSLDAAGIPSIVITNSDRDLAAYSQLPLHKYVIPEDAAWEDSVLSLLDRLALKDKAPIIACSDRAANFLSDYRDALTAHCQLLIPGDNVIHALNDKRIELELMLKQGVSVPGSITRINDNDNTSLTFPVIVKPRTFEGYKTLAAKNLIIDEADDWDRFLIRYSDKLDEFIAQTVISGDDTNLWVCNATFDKASNMVCAFSFRRLGTSPSHYGVTSLAKSEINQRVLELSEKVGKALSYVGPAMFEFKYDPQTQDYLYIETNPRLGMCNWFDTQCGINNVAASYYAALDYDGFSGGQQTEGRYFWYFTSDLIARLEDRESIYSIIKLYLKMLLQKKVWAIFMWKDIRPFLYMIINDIKIIFKRGSRFLWKRARFFLKISSGRS